MSDERMFFPSCKLFMSFIWAVCVCENADVVIYLIRPGVVH